MLNGATVAPSASRLGYLIVFVVLTALAHAYESAPVVTRKRKAGEEAMTVKRIAASVILGLFLWFVLLFIHEEWRLPFNQEAFGPPPFNPFNVWTPSVLIAGIWWSLNAFLRWADRPEESRKAG